MVHPSDKQSLAKIFRVNTSLWGGVFNPIIPVFSRPPNIWKVDHKTDLSYGVARGYIDYFEPDVFVEAQKGLAEKVGIPSEFRDRNNPKIVSLDNFWDSRELGVQGPRIGISMSEVLRHNYVTERKFVLRDDHRDNFQTYPKDDQQLAALALFGGYHNEGSAKSLATDYQHVFEPVKANSFKDAWQKRTFENFASELALTADSLEPSRFGVNRPTFFIFDPNSPHDLIDYWNLRAQALGRVHPIPLKYWKDFSGKLHDLATKYFEPASKGRFERGITLELARSISSKDMLAGVQQETSKWNKSLVTFKLWRDQIWDGHSHVHSSGGVDVSRAYAAEETRILKNDGDGYLRLETIDPDFAISGYRSEFSWVNVLRISDDYHEIGMATTVPFNVMEDYFWHFSIIDETTVNSEGWCLPRRHSMGSELLHMSNAFDCFKEFFKKNGFSIRRSEAGVIAEQMFAALSEDAAGLMAVGIFASAERLKFFNKYAMGQRVRSDGSEVKEESFPTKSISLKEFQTHVKKVGQKRVTRESLLSALISYKVLRLGIGVKCPHCFHENWFDLDSVGYSLICELCRKDFQFPEHDLGTASENWKYRLIGPFATPDYARGSYSALLTARLLSDVSGRDHQLTFCSGVELTSPNEKHEADLVCWLREQGEFNVLRNPKLVFAECKSFAAEALKSKDFARMAALAKRFPNAALVFSVLKDKLSDREQTLARAFIQKNAGRLKFGRYERPVVFLTGSDLFFDYSLSAGKDARYSRNDTGSLSNFAAASQRLNLNMHC